MKPELEKILSLPPDEFRKAVLRNAMPLAHEIKGLGDDDRSRVREVVLSNWPEAGIAASVEQKEHSVTFRDLGAYAWLTLGPVLDLAPSPEQWASLATSGIALTETTNWLEHHYSEQAATIAAETCNAPETRPWADLLASIPLEAGLPDVVVDAILEHVTEPSDAELDFWLYGIADRFVREDRLPELVALSAKNDDFELRLRPYRARLGDVQAASELLDQLVEDLQKEKRVDSDDVGWLEGISDADRLSSAGQSELLPKLFAALLKAVLQDDQSPFGPFGEITRAIHYVGGKDAVRRYDELIESSEDSRVKFLRIQRDRLVQEILRSVGQEQAAKVASRLGIPVLDAVVSDESR